MFVLDTNILIYASQQEAAVSAFLLGELHTPRPLLIPTVAITEFVAFTRITARDRNFLDSFLSTARHVDLTMPIAFLAGDLRRQYKLKLGDSIVAATALKTNSTLVTRNVRDFTKIPKLKLKAV